MKRRDFIRTAGAAAFFGPLKVAFAQTAPPLEDVNSQASKISIPWLLRGYDEVLGSGRDRLLNGDQTQTGFESSLIGNICTSFKQLTQTLRTDNSVSLGFDAGAYGGSVSDKNSFVSSLNLREYSVSLVISLDVVMTTATVDNVSPRFPVSVQTPADLKKFIQKYGSSYFSEIALGGYFYALYIFHSTSSEEQTQVVNSLQANGVYDGVSVGVETSSSLQKSFDQISTEKEFRYHCGGFSHVEQAQSPDKIVALALRLSGMTPDSPVVVRSKTTGYEEVLGDSFQPALLSFMMKTREYFCDPDSGLNSTATNAKLLNTQAEDIANIYKQYDYQGDPTIGNLLKNSQDDLGKIIAQRRQYESDPSVELSALNFIIDYSQGAPVLSFDVKYFDAGGPGGNPFDDIPDIAAYLQKGMRISGLQVAGAGCVDRLVVHYVDKGGHTTEMVHGGPGGSPFSWITLAVGKEVQSIPFLSGTAAGRTVVIRLGFTYPDEDGNIKTIGFVDGQTPDNPIPTDYHLIGFKGQCAKWLDHITPVLIRFQPARIVRS